MIPPVDLPRKEDQHSSHDFPGMREVNGYREWENLDAVFQSMGPNPFLGCFSVGALRLWGLTSSGLLCCYMGSCQNYGTFLGPYYNTAPNI